MEKLCRYYGKEEEKDEKQKKSACSDAGRSSDAGCFPTTVGAVNNAYDATKPADGTTKKQPFLAGTGGSTISESRDLLR